MFKNDDNMLKTIVATIIIVWMCSLVGATEHDTGYLTNRAKAAIAIQQLDYSPLEPLSIPQKIGLIPEPETHPELRQCLKPMTMYVTSWCVYCPGIKQVLGLDPEFNKLHPEFKVNHDFNITVIDVTNKEMPDYVTSYPFFIWDTPKGQRYCEWSGTKDLVARHENSFKQIPVPKVSSSTPLSQYPSFHGYRPRWSWPGDLRNHLLRVHGVGEALSLTQDQAEALHDALHEGHSATKIRQYYRK